LICNAGATLVAAASLTSLRQLPLDRSMLTAALAAVALAPTSGEIFGTLSNVQWFTQLYLLVPVARFLSGDPARRPMLSYTATLIVGLTGPFAPFALAAAAGGVLTLWAQSRLMATPKRLPQPNMEIGLLVACTIVQSYLIARNAPTPLLPTFDALLQIGAALQVHTLGERWLPNAAFFLVTLVTASTTILYAESAKARAVLVAAGIFIAAQLWTVACRQGGAPDPAFLFNSDRYYLFFKIGFWACFVQALRVVTLQYEHAALPVALVGMTGVALVNFQNLVRHPLVNLDWPRYAEHMDRGEAVTVPINPQPWKLSLPERQR